MVVSGYFFYPSVSKMTFSQYANKKFKRLYLPSLVWGVFQAILIGTGKLFKGKTLDIYYFSELVVTGMWFLTVLFILCMIGALINTITKKRIYLLWGVAYLVIYILPCEVFMGNELKFLTPFFILGIWVRNKGWSGIPHKMGIICMGIYILCSCYYSFSDSYYQMSGNPLTLIFFISTLFRTLCGTVGVISSVYLCRYIFKFEFIKKYFIRIGMVSLPIYVLHQKFLMPTSLVSFESFSSFNCYLIPMVVSLLIIESSLLLYKYIKSPMLKLYLFGEIKE